MGTFFSIVFALGLVIYVIQMLLKGYQEDEASLKDFRRKMRNEPPSLHERLKRDEEQKRRNAKLATPPELPKRVLKPSLKSHKQDLVKLQYCEEKHFENVDQAGIMIGGLAGIEERGYQGETKSISEKVLTELDEGYAASTVIRDLLDEKYQGTVEEKINIADLLEEFEQLNDITEQDLIAIEGAWGTIAERLESIDQRYKDISLAILEHEKLSLRDGMFRINGKDWREILSADIEAIFEQSKGDPLGAINQSMAGVEALLVDAETVIVRLKQDRAFFKDWLVSKLSELERRGLNDSWIISGLRDVEYDLFRAEEDYLDPLKLNAGMVLKLSDDLEQLRMESGDTLLDRIAEVEQKVARACGIAPEVVFHNAEYEREVSLIDEMISLYHEALQQGDMPYAEKCREKVQKRIREITKKMDQTQEAAFQGQQMHRELNKLYTKRCADLDDEVQAFQVILDRTLTSVFQEEVVDYIDRSVEIKKDLLGRLDEVKKSLEEGAFVATISGMEHIELKLDHMQSTCNYLKKARLEMAEMEQNNGALLIAAKARFGELMAKKNRVYVSSGSDALFTEVEECMSEADTLLARVKKEKKQVDPRELAAKVYRIQVTLVCLEDALEEDQKLHEFLKQKVVEVDEVSAKVNLNLKQVASDGIEDSKLTKELVQSLSTMLDGWPKLKDKLDDPAQDWSELRFEYDVFFHGLESINVRLEQDLRLAEEASEQTQEVSEHLHRVSAWRGENGMRVELVECSKIVHNAMRSLNNGDYKEAIVQATYGKNEITRELHAANRKDVDTQLTSSRIRTRTVGGRSVSRDNSSENETSYLME